MLIPLAVGGLILLRAARTYPRDVATAMASEAAAHPPDAARARGGSGEDDVPEAG